MGLQDSMLMATWLLNVSEVYLLSNNTQHAVSVETPLYIEIYLHTLMLLNLTLKTM